MHGLIRNRHSAPATARAAAWLLAALCLTAHASAPAAAPASNEGFVVEVHAGETLQQIAARHLGDEHAAGELQRFNRLETSVSDPIPEGVLLAIPGPIRAEARLAIATAAGLAEQARAADAANLSPTLLDKGGEALDRARAWLADAAYDRAASSAVLARRHFEAAVQEADAKAVKPLRASVMRQHGDNSFCSSDGPGSIPLSRISTFLDEARLSTDTNGVVEVALGESAGLFLEPSTQVELLLLQHDARTGMTRGQVQVTQGEASVGVRGGATSIEMIGRHGLSTVVTGGLVRLSVEDQNEDHLAVWEADAQLLTQDGMVVLPMGTGARLTATGPSLLPALPTFVLPPPGSPVRLARQPRPVFTPIPPVPAGAEMQVELARDPAFLDRILRLPPGVAQCPVAFPSGVVHVRARWAVAPGADLISGPWSASWPLDIRPDLALTLAPQPAPLRVDNIDLHGPATTLHVTLSTAAAVARLDASWNDRPFAPATPPLSIPADLDGDITLRVRAVSETGENGPEAVWRGRIDRTGPEVRTRVETLHRPGGGPESRVEVEAVDPAGLERIEYRDPTGAWLTYVRAVEIKPPARHLVVRAVDRLGNASAELTLPVATP